MKDQIINTKEGAQARVNNLSAMQMAELESQMEQEAIKEQMVLAELECQAEQDAIAEAMYIEDLVYEEELACFCPRLSNHRRSSLMPPPGWVLPKN